MTTSGVVVLMLSLAAAARAAPGAEEKAAATGPPQTVLIGAKDQSTCRTFAPGKRTVRTNLKPDTDLGDLIAWISTITCKQFLLPGTIPAGKKVTVVAPELITPEEAYRLFLGALDSAGLTIEHAGKFERIVETAKIKTMGGIPDYDVPQTGSYVTRMVPRASLSPRERARLREFDIHNGPLPPPEAFVLITEVVRVIGEKNARACKPAPAGTRGVKLNLRPDTRVDDLIAWIASVTCKQFMLPDTIPPDSKRVTVVAPERITPEEAYALFLAALDSVNLAVEGSGNFLRVIDVAEREPLVTRLVREEFVDPQELAQILGRLKSERGKITVVESTGAVVITDLQENLTRMKRVLTEY